MSSLAKRPIPISLRDLLDRNSFFIIALTLLFAVSFALPLSFAIKFGGAAYYEDSSTEIIESDNNFLSKSPHVTQPNSFLKVKSTSVLHPEEGKDFMMIFWIRPKKLPANGERVMIMSKIDNESASRRGYALAIQKESGGIRPLVYWRDEKGDGTWFTFSEMDIVPKSWLMLAVSFRDAKYLGMHGAVYVEQLAPQLKLLGGYQLEKRILPSSNSNMLIGSFSGGLFRGEIGPTGIVSAESLSERLEGILNDTMLNPEKLPSRLSNNEIKLWTIDGKNDLSASKNEVEFIRPKRGEK